MKILLLVPPKGYYARRYSPENTFPHLGLGYVAASLRQAGFAVEILDAYVKRLSCNALGPLLKQKNPDVVGVTFTTETRFEGFETIRTAKRSLPGATIIAGGPHVTAAAEDTLLHIPELDIIVRGEAEETIVELARTLQYGMRLETIHGISYRQDGQIRHNPNRPWIKDLDSLPFPARDLFDPKDHTYIFALPDGHKVIATSLVTMRGCPYRCNFCFSSSMWGHAVRMRSPENILQEIDEIVDGFGIKGMWFYDDTFTIDRARTKELCQLIVAHHPDIRWYCQTRVNNVDKELLATMKEAGCCYISFGVESGCQRIIDQVVDKHIRLEQVRKAAAWCKELDIAANFTFIVSHPAETITDARQTLNLVADLMKDHEVNMGVMKIHPGTEIERIARLKGILPKDFSWAKEYTDEVFAMPLEFGSAPIFMDKMSWSEISALVIEYAAMKKIPIWQRVPRILSNIRTTADVVHYLTALVSYLRYNLSRLIPIRSKHA
ncbi:MAG: B12-binding domain-containing radical SAM protein [Chloroflexi bacterium]|nr:B12-binding domain-containing radical SAM protein [Chloroflexota bacterium]MCL5075286.1 B12-binding domain-containing radical SAM protein [Chloroflexota bacterium]